MLLRTYQSEFNRGAVILGRRAVRYVSATLLWAELPDMAVLPPPPPNLGAPVAPKVGMCELDVQFAA